MFGLSPAEHSELQASGVLATDYYYYYYYFYYYYYCYYHYLQLQLPLPLHSATERPACFESAFWTGYLAGAVDQYDPHLQ